MATADKGQPGFTENEQLRFSKVPRARLAVYIKGVLSLFACEAVDFCAGVLGCFSDYVNRFCAGVKSF